MLGNMYVVQFVLMYGLLSVALAATIPLDSAAPPACDLTTGIGCMPSPKDCPEGCPCNRTDVEVDETETESITEMEVLRPSEKMEFKFVRTVTNYGSSGLSGRLNEKVQYVFRGIIVSAILFIACACVCVMSVCVYCCHIRRTDSKLKQEVDALAKKLKIDVKKKAGPSKKRILDPKEESCNVVVQDANVMCV